jgi:hypothetical protein
MYAGNIAPPLKGEMTMVKKISIAGAVVLAAFLAAPSASFAAKKASHATSNADWRNTPIPNQSAQFYRHGHHKSTKQQKSEPKS